MTNPLIDNITWDPNNPSASVQNLLTQLTALQAEWEEKRSRFLQITTLGQKSLATWLSLPGHRNSSRDIYVGLDPSIPEADSTLRIIRGQLLPLTPAAGVGHKERLYLDQSTILVPNASVETTYLFQETVTLPRDAYILGVHPVIVKPGGGGSCDVCFRPLIDGDQVFEGILTGRAPRPGVTLEPLLTFIETLVTIVWASPLIPAGTHDIEMDLISAPSSGGATSSNVAPLFNYHSTSMETGVMPAAYVQPSVSYLEFIYQ